METDFDGTSKELIWCDRSAFPYEQIKRQAEYALWQEYPQKNWIAVRYPFAIGKDDYVEAKTGARAVISNEGDEAPYNGEPEYSINTDQAKKLGYRFSALKDWIYELLDYYIKTIN